MVSSPPTAEEAIMKTTNEIQSTIDDPVNALVADRWTPGAGFVDALAGRPAR